MFLEQEFINITEETTNSTEVNIPKDNPDQVKETNIVIAISNSADVMLQGEMGLPFSF